MKNKTLVFVSSHEATNNYIFSILKKKLKFKYYLITSNLGSEFFKKRKIRNYEVHNFTQLKKILYDLSPDYLFTVPQFFDSFENRSIEVANKYNIKTITAIDNWFPIKDRFKKIIGRSEKYFNTDYILVNDQKVKSELLDIYNSKQIICTGNPYLEQRWKQAYLTNIKKKYNTKKSKFSNSLLFISEPYSDLSSKNKNLVNPGFSEIKILKDVVKILDKKIKLYIKLHPSENRKKYDKLARSNNNIFIIYNQNIDEIILNCKKIIGMGSMLLIEAGLIRNDVISYRPSEHFKFVGNEYKITNLARTIKELQNKINSSKKRMRSKKIFKNSTKKITNFLNSTLQ